MGRYENGVLIVETTKFPFDPTGLDDMYNIPSSTQKRVVERYWRDGDTLKADIVTEDPLFLTRPVQFQFEWQRTDDAARAAIRLRPRAREAAAAVHSVEVSGPELHRIAGVAEHAAVTMTHARY